MNIGQNTSSTSTTAQAKILVVEDNLINRKVLSKQLEILGYEVVTAVNGQLAVDYVRANPVDCILMDCQMPIMDGYDATRAIRQWEGDQRRIRIIGLTAYSQQEDLEKCLTVGMDDYLEKPALADDLRKMLAKWLTPMPHADFRPDYFPKKAAKGDRQPIAHDYQIQYS